VRVELVRLEYRTLSILPTTSIYPPYNKVCVLERTALHLSTYTPVHLWTC